MSAEVRGRALAKEKKYLAAAEALAEALQGVPSTERHRGERHQLALEAVNAYQLAFDGEPTRCEIVAAGLKLADEYLDDLHWTYGVVVGAADFSGMTAARGELERARTASRCPAPEIAEPPPRPPPIRYTAEPEPEVAPRSTKARTFGVGVGVSAGLAIGMAIGSGILFTQLRKPGGSLYKAIVMAAPMDGVTANADTDMCEGTADKPHLGPACNAWNSGFRGFVAMTVLSGLFAISTAVFTGLLIHDRRPHRRLAQAWRRHQVQIGAAPRFGEATVMAGFRF